MTDHFQLPATVDSPCGGFARFSALMKGKLYKKRLTLIDIICFD